MLKKSSNILKVGLAAAIVATSFLVTPIAAQAQSGARSDGSFQVADHRGGWRGHNRDWRRHHHNRHRGWRGGPRYYHRDNNNWGGAAAAGIIGLAAGAMIANSANQPRYYAGDNYNAYCSSRYRSFNPRTGTYTGYDGLQHRCVMR
jgi:Ni/Co efflux regulator RcnB